MESILTQYYDQLARLKRIPSGLASNGSIVSSMPGPVVGGGYDRYSITNRAMAVLICRGTVAEIIGHFGDRFLIYKDENWYLQDSDGDDIDCFESIDELYIHILKGIPDAT